MRGRRVGSDPRVSNPALTERLIQELRNPKEEGATHDDPFIIEETVNEGPLKHVLVIWDRWDGVAMEDRGTVIMDAYEQFSGEEAQNISLAMGTTYEQAAKLNLAPQDVVGKVS